MGMLYLIRHGQASAHRKITTSYQNWEKNKEKSLVAISLKSK